MKKLDSSPPLRGGRSLCERGDVTTLLKYNKGLKFYARNLRAEMTHCEHLLWGKIRRKQILGIQFYRQKPVGPYILDFYANFPRIAIELDGSHHLMTEQNEKDIERDLYLISCDIRVLRFSNLDVLQNCDGVLQMIADTVIELKE